MFAGPLHPVIAGEAFAIGLIGGAAVWTRVSPRIVVTAMGAAAAAALAATVRLGSGAELGLALLVAGAVLSTTRRPWVAAPLVAVGFAFVSSGLPVVASARGAPVCCALAAILTVCLGLAADDLGIALVLVLLTISSAGAWSTLPDTEGALAVGAATFGAAVPAIVALVRAKAPVRVPSGAVGGVWRHAVWAPWAASFSRVVVASGAVRPSSVVGASAALGVVLVWPLGRAGWSRQERRRRWTAPATFASLVAVQVLAALLAGRVAGLRPSPVAAAVVAGIDLVVLTGCVTLVGPVRPGGRAAVTPD